MVSIRTHRPSVRVFDTGEYHQPASVVYSLYSRSGESQMTCSIPQLVAGRLRLVLSVNRLVASGLTGLRHGEG